MAFDLLTEPLVEAEEGGVPIGMALPELMAAWSARRDVTLRGLRRHQVAPMHMFLCQVAAATAMRDGDEALSPDAEIWRGRLLSAAPAGAWHLLQEDHAVAAFLQPPLAGALVAKAREDYPDDLTILVTSKNHGAKQSIIGRPTPWTWAAALVELQTMSGYSGAGNQGIARMNGGVASRAMVSVYTDMSAGGRWRRDVSRLVDLADTLHARTALYAPRGTGTIAAWTRPWDGVAQLSLSSMDPLFVEVCRAVRLARNPDGSLYALRATTPAARMAGVKELKGVLGDPWSPLDEKGAKSLTVNDDGWSLRRLRQLLLPSADNPYVPSLLQEPGETETGDLFLHADVLVGGNGKTGGYHAVTLPIPGRMRFRLFGSKAERESLGKLAQAMTEDAADVSRALRRAVLAFVQGRSLDALNLDANDAEGTVSAFGRAVADRFFPALWEFADTGTDQGFHEWLADAARGKLEEAIASLPSRMGTSFASEVRARAALGAALASLKRKREGATGAAEVTP